MNYQVRQIVGRRVYNAQLQYKVLWIGYPDTQFTWEPFDNLSNVCYLVHQFENVYGTADQLFISPCKFCHSTGQDKGSFKNQDRPQRLVKLRKKDQELFVKVQWKKRKTGAMPGDSWVSTNELKKNYALMLVQFYESMTKWQVVK